MSTDNTHPTLIEQLPIEIFLKVFASLSLQDIVRAFTDLNAYIDSIVRCIRGASLAVSNNNEIAVVLLHLFSTQISRFIITRAETVDFTSLINLRSLTIKYGALAQFDGIRPQNSSYLAL